jgi:hypothetical protein
VGSLGCGDSGMGHDEWLNGICILEDWNIGDGLEETIQSSQVLDLIIRSVGIIIRSLIGLINT